MKIGFENRKRGAAACALISLAFLLLSRFLPPTQTSSFTVHSATSNESLLDGIPKGRKHDDSTSLDPMLHDTLLEFAESKHYVGSGRNIFRAASDPTANRVSRTPMHTQLQTPPTPALAAGTPQISLRFFGFVSMLDAPRKGFFGDADALFVASEGEIIDRRYRIVRIELNQVEVEDLIEHSTHTLSLPG